MYRSFLALLLIASAALSVRSQDQAVNLDEAAEEIDAMLESSWKVEGITPAPRSSDAAFHRRVWLDLAGVAPPVAATRQFLADSHDDKRGELVERLLHSPQYANHMATRWNQALLPPDAQSQLQQQGNVAALHRWLRDQFYSNVPYDHLVGSFLTAGGAGDSGPAIFYTSHSVQPEKLAAATSRIFLGLQLQCAQCHDHPFDRWTQKDFWQYAAFFSQLEQSDMQGGRETLIEDRPGREVKLPDTDQVMSPRYPGVSEPPEKDPRDIRRRQLTIWLASRDNPYFARAAANRAWEHLFGRGIVDPVDAMDLDNRPSHPELLEFLANHLIQLRFDLRKFYATLARTRAYGRSSALPTAQRPPENSFAAMTVKTLTAEQYYDSLLQNVFCRSGLPQTDSVPGFMAARQPFLARMHAVGSSPRDYPHGVVQVLGMMNGPEILAASSQNQVGLMSALEAPFFDDDQRIETIFLAALSRYPTEVESEQARQFVTATTTQEDATQEDATQGDTAAAFGDLLWVLLNTAECAMCP